MTIISNLMINILYLNYCFKGTVFWKTKFVWYIISLLFLNIGLWGQKPTVIISTDPIELNEKYRFVDEDIYAEDPETGDQGSRHGHSSTRPKSYRRACPGSHRCPDHASHSRGNLFSPGQKLLSNTPGPYPPGHYPASETKIKKNRFLERGLRHR